ncbi:MAG: tripartite tricarboxylate transporter substrate binding protein [Burkholderiales bacterium]|nr:tripartite tricarboxylate transporter substrate binding protein [Burkholderiales bacterium]
MKLMHPLGLALIAASSVLVAGTAHAQDFPSKPIRLIAPYASGGGNDLMARTVAEGMAKILKRPVIVENRAGAGGSVGILSVAKAEPDGHAIVMGGIGSMVLRAAVQGSKMPFDPHKDLAPVALIASASPVLVASRSINASSLSELVALAKSQTLSYGSAGVGSAMHLTGELMQQVAGIELLHVPHQGQGPALTALLGGHINFVFTDVSLALRHVASERLRMLAIAGRTRAPQLPAIPTTAESGLAGLVMENWYALYAPKDTPKPVLAKLTGAAIAAIQLPEIAQVIEKSTALVPIGADGDAVRVRMAEDTARWTPVVRKANITQ